MKDRCYAKINLSLNVVGKREDGYHLLESIMIPIKYYDLLEMNISDEDDYSANKKYFRFDENNTIIKMLNAFKEKYNINDKYQIRIDKYIPSQAGLGGGSSDGASTLRLLQRLYRMHLDKEEIKYLCNKVGSDVLFTYYNKPALVKGIGDELEFFKIKKKYYCLLVKPRSGVSTKAAYENLNLELCDHPDVYKLRDALINGDDIMPYLGNSLEESALRLCPDIKEVMDNLKNEGAEIIRMSGSGSCVFCISDNQGKILNLYKKMQNYHYLLRFSEFL